MHITHTHRGSSWTNICKIIDSVFAYKCHTYTAQRECVCVASISVAISGYYNRKWSCSKIHATVKGAKCANKEKEQLTFDSRHFDGWQMPSILVFFVSSPFCNISRRQNTLCIFPSVVVLRNLHIKYFVRITHTFEHQVLASHKSHFIDLWQNF